MGQSLSSVWRMSDRRSREVGAGGVINQVDSDSEKGQLIWNITAQGWPGGRYGLHGTLCPRSCKLLESSADIELNLIPLTQEVHRFGF